MIGYIACHSSYLLQPGNGCPVVRVVQIGIIQEARDASYHVAAGYRTCHEAPGDGRYVTEPCYAAG